MNKKDIGFVVFLISLLMHIINPLSVGNYVTYISIAGLVIGFILLMSD